MSMIGFGFRPRELQQGDGQDRRALGHGYQGDARDTSRLFYHVPVGAELCDPYPTEDMTTMFVAIQLRQCQR